MNGAELRTVRESMGLSMEWLAQRLPNPVLGRMGISVKTLRRWERDNQDIPGDVAEHLNELMGLFVGLVDRELDKADNALRSGAQVILERYSRDSEMVTRNVSLAGFPAAFHAAALFLARERLLHILGYRPAIRYVAGDPLLAVELKKGLVAE